MHCPACKKEFHAASSQCGSCGQIFGRDMQLKLELYFEIRGEAERIKGIIKEDLWTSSRNVLSKVRQFETLIEKDLSALSGKVAAAEMPHPDTSEMPAAVGTPEVKGPPPAVPVETTALPRPAPPGPTQVPDHFEVKFGQKWLLIIGIVTMVFGVGYFLKYSFEQGWIGPAGRVSMAYVWGIVFMIAGNLFRKKKYETFGLYLVGGGIATLYFSTFAAFQLYQLIGQAPSFAIMVLITVLAATLAVLYDTKWLAVLGISGGFLTPVMLSTGQDNQIVLMTYMTILNAGLLGIAFYKKWDLLNVFGFFFTYLLYSAWFGSHYSSGKFWPAIIFLNIFFLIYSVIPFAYQFFRKESAKMEGFLIILPNSLLALGFGYYMISGYASYEWVTVVTVSYAVIFLLMATYLYQSGKQEQEAFVVLVAKAALFLVISIPLIFSEHWITVFWAVQAAALLWMGIRLDRKPLLIGAYVLLALAAAKFLMHDYDAVFHASFFYSSARQSFMHMLPERIITSAMVLASLYIFGYSAKQESLNIVSGKKGGDAAVLFTLFGAMLFIVLNMETSLFFRAYLPAAGFAALSVLWTVFSVALMMLGFRNNSPMLRMVSLGLFAVTLAKVFLFDMENISTPYRIVSFIILGLVLVGTSYLYYKFKDRILDAMSADRS